MTWQHFCKPEPVGWRGSRAKRVSAAQSSVTQGKQQPDICKQVSHVQGTRNSPDLTDLASQRGITPRAGMRVPAGKVPAQ